LVLSIAKNAQSSEFASPIYFSASKNISGYGEEIVPVLKRRISKEVPKLTNITWNEEFAVKTAHVLTSMSIGFCFNLAPVEEIFQVSR